MKGGIQVAKEIEGIETSEALRYITNNSTSVKMWNRVREACNDLLAKYSDILTNSEVCKAKSLCWGCNTPGEYANKFLVLVLMNGYYVWNESHARYIQLLNAIERENPRWVSRFINEHENKLKRCKVPIYPIGEVVGNR